MKKILFYILGAFAGMMILSSIITSCLNTNEKNACTTAMTEKQSQDSAKMSDTTSNWQYAERTDEMSDKTDYFATIVSSNFHELDFPYQGGSWGKLTVRKSQKYGLDVYFNISQGQLLCSDYHGTNYVTVRFDDKPTKKYYTAEPSDLSSDVLFLKNAKDFINNAKLAKTIKVQVPVYEAGNLVFKFNTNTPLQWEH